MTPGTSRNAAESLDEATMRAQAITGRPAPRCAVMARAAECRKAGIEMKRLEASGVKAMG